MNNSQQQQQQSQQHDLEQEVKEQVKKIKKNIERHTLKESDLIKENGIKMLYQNISKIGLDYEDGFDEIKNLRKLSRLIQEWHFQLMPKYQFQYFMQRCHKLGSKPSIKSYMSRLRNIHKGEMDWNDLQQIEVGQQQIEQPETVVLQPQSLYNLQSKQQPSNNYKTYKNDDDHLLSLMYQDIMEHNQIEKRNKL